MERVVILGRGGSGKTTLSRRLGELTGLPVLELDKMYWDESLTVLTPEEWGHRQSQVVTNTAWILDGDLGPYDATKSRLERADTVVILETHAIRCVTRALRRGVRRRDFWVWMLGWARVHRPRILREVRQYAPMANLVVLKTPREVSKWLDQF